MRSQQRRIRNGRQQDVEELDADTSLRDLSCPESGRNRRGLQSITHLLDLNYRSLNEQSSGSAPRPKRHTDRRYKHSNSQRYVNANYRFVLHPDGDYQLQFTDPDEHIDWNEVLQVLASSSSQMSSCLFCLDTPTAPRMVKCGHIFCLPCMLHFMNANEGKSKYRNCPVCAEPFELHEARPVRWFTSPAEPELAIAPGSEVVLQLMKRPAGAVVSFPRELLVSLNAANTESIPWHYTDGALDHSRLMLGTSEYMTQQLEEELTSLTIQRDEDILMYGDGNLHWVNRAIESIQSQLKKLQDLSSTRPKRRRSRPTTPTEAVKSSAKVQERAKGTENYYYYQLPRHCYLSSLDIKILRKAFGNYDLFPEHILTRVDHVSRGWTVDTELRRRTRYLSHLPEGCEVEFLECDFTGLVPDDVLAQFKPELDRRRKQNKAKDDRDDRARNRAEMLERHMQMAELGHRWDNSGWLDPDADRELGADIPPTLNDQDFAPLPSSGGGDGPVEQETGVEEARLQKTAWGTTVVNGNGAHDYENATDCWLAGWDDQVLNPVNQESGAGGQRKKGRKGKKTVTLMSTAVRRGA